MPIRVALNHQTSYRFDRAVQLSPHIIRLRPAPHSRTPVNSYSLTVLPNDHFLNWQQDPHGNYQARFVFPDRTTELSVEVDLVADLSVVNPFDFFVESIAETWPFAYEPSLGRDLKPFLELDETSPLLDQWLATVDRTPQNTVDFLVALNQRLQQEISYLIRMEPGVQTCQETLTRGSGSCRDTSWLLVQILRHLGIAARFASGYLIQLKPDVASLDGPSGATEDFTDLHAWTEAFLPGAGWIGLDPTSGLLTGEGHIPLACTPTPATAAPISGAMDACETEFNFSMKVTRIHEDPRVTKPYRDEQWRDILQVGRKVDQQLQADDVRLTMGGEPTFVSIDDMEGDQWNTAALGTEKRKRAIELLARLRNHVGPTGLLHYGQGKWYPGESLPRWAFSCIWRTDGQPIWNDHALLGDPDQNAGVEIEGAQRFVEKLAANLEVDASFILPAYENVWHHLAEERKLPDGLDPSSFDPHNPTLKTPEERARLAQVIERGIGSTVGFVLPLQRQWWQAKPKWISGKWPIRSEVLFLLPGDSPIGFRLPLETLPTAEELEQIPVDPSIPRSPLPATTEIVRQVRSRSKQPDDRTSGSVAPKSESGESESQTIHSSLCVEPRSGSLHVFMPPTRRVEDYLDLLASIEESAKATEIPVVIEGYLPPPDSRIQCLKVTPDPGVIEVNTAPVASWDELVESTSLLYEEARLSRLGTEKFDLDGKHTGTGGGNHIVLGGPTTLDSPFLRRPDLLKSLVGYWNNHPSLSYLFSSSFIGPTSQAPRVDEGRRDSIYELEIAFEQVPKRDSSKREFSTSPWLVDRLFRDLLIDLTGNTHRAEFCIDKLYSPDSSTGRLGLVELRGFEMPPHARMSLTQQLLLRALVARFWRDPCSEQLIHWGTTLHDRFLLPHFAWQDLVRVVEECRSAGFALQAEWFAPHFEFRFPLIGAACHCGMELELRQAVEPWYVLGEEPGAGGTTRFVDSSVERLQVRLTGHPGDRYVVTCNGRTVPLTPTCTEGEFVAGVRYRAWQPPSCLHPNIPVHSPLVFDLFDRFHGRSVGGCTYHVFHPTGRHYETFPVNAYEAESRRGSRFFAEGHTPGPAPEPTLEHNPLSPLTLDLRRSGRNIRRGDRSSGL